MKQYEKLQTDMQQNLSIDEISGYLFALKDGFYNGIENRFYCRKCADKLGLG